MGNQTTEAQDFLITLNDCLNLFKKGAWKIAIGGAGCSALLGFYAITKPIQYEAEATFKEKGSSQGSVGGNPLATVLISSLSGGSKSEARTIMRSRTFMEQVVRMLGLNGTISQEEGGFPFFRTIADNLRVEYSYAAKRAEFPLVDAQKPLKAEGIYFPGLLPISLKLIFQDEENFDVYNVKKELLGKGKLGQPYHTQDFGFILKRQQPTPLAKQTFYLNLNPLADTAKALAAAVEIEPHKDDPTLLKLKYRHGNRLQASLLLNQIMESYQGHLRDEQQRISSEQIAYLYSREEEMGETLREMLQSYAKKISTEVSLLGYPDSEKGMAFLTAQLQQYKRRKLEIDLELSMRQRYEEKGMAQTLQFMGDAIPHALHELLTAIRELKQQSDSIELALRNSSGKNLTEWHITFNDQVKELEDIRLSAEETQKILEDLNHSITPSSEIALLDHPKFMVRDWHDQLRASEKSIIEAPLEEKEHKRQLRDQFKAQYASYLNNLSHFLEVNEKTVQERLSHQQAPQFEFQGLDLSSSKSLYMEYSRHLSNLEAQILQIQFLIDQIQDPDFEVCSLSTVLDDPVTRALVNKASENVLAIQDDSNRGPKEKERLKKELLTQKKFLDLHLRQSLQLLQLRENLLKDKIQTLNNATLELIHQQVSILENQLKEGIDAHTEKLDQEKELIVQQENILRQEMAKLPQKWANEKLIDHQVKMNTAMVEEMTKLVESKNIASNLEMVQSAPLDTALPPLKPIRPKILLFSFIGGVLGVFLSMGALLAQALTRGIPASKENLELAGLYVAGTVTPLPEHNLSTWRRLFAHLGTTPKGQTLALVAGDQPDHSRELAALLSKKGDKVAIVDLRFQERPAKDQLPALLQVLDGEAENPKMQQETFCLRIASGGITPHAAEYIQSKKLRTLLNTLAKEYDWVIGISKASALSPEAESLLQLFDHSVLFIRNETLDTLQPLIHLSKALPDQKSVSYVLVS